LGKTVESLLDPLFVLAGLKQFAYPGRELLRVRLDLLHEAMCQPCQTAPTFRPATSAFPWSATRCGGGRAARHAARPDVCRI